MLKEFREFVLRGNVVDLAVAVVIGAAFGAVVTAFVADFVTPLIAAIGELATVRVLDLKGHYRGTPVDVETDPELYRQVAEAFPAAYLEDPDVNDETRALLEPLADRLTWDAPLHSLADIEALEWQPKAINSKPSRFGSCRRLFEFYDACTERGIRLYGGGQFELGPGRDQIQYLASLFHPDAPNDVAPREYNRVPVPPGLPKSPLPASPVVSLKVVVALPARAAVAVKTAAATAMTRIPCRAMPASRSR